VLSVTKTRVFTFSRPTTHALYSSVQVFVELDGCLARTAVRKNTLNPVWVAGSDVVDSADSGGATASGGGGGKNDGRDSTFQLYSLTRQSGALNFAVFDWDADGGHDPLGNASVDLSDLPIGALVKHSVSLEGEHKNGRACQGLLSLKLLLEPNFATNPMRTFVPPKSVPTATVLRAESFPAQVGLYRLLFVVPPPSSSSSSVSGGGGVGGGGGLGEFGGVAPLLRLDDGAAFSGDERAALQRAVATLSAVGVKDCEWLGHVLLGDVAEALEKQLDSVFEQAVLLYDGDEASDTAVVNTASAPAAPTTSGGGGGRGKRSVTVATASSSSGGGGGFVKASEGPRRQALKRRLDRMTLEATLEVHLLPPSPS
jgi:hypothetical protein